MSRRLVIGLFALIVAMAVTVWTLVLVREEPPPPPPARAERPASPDATDDASAEEQRRAAAAASAAAGAPPQPAPATPPAETASVPAPPPAAPEAAPTPPVVETPAVVATPAPIPPAQEPPAQEPPAQESQAVEVKPEVKPEPAPEAVPAAPAADAAAPTAPGPLVLAPEGPPAPQPATVLPPRPPLVLAPEAPPPADSAPTVLPPSAPPVAAAPPPPPPPPPAPRRTPPSFDVVRVTIDGSAVIAGRAEAGALVQVFDGERELGRTTADARGEWVLLPNAPMAPGTRQLSLVARGPGDLPDVKSERVVVVVVPERQQAAQVGGALAVAMPRDTSAEPSRALQVPSTAPRQAPAITLAVETIDYDGSGNVVLAGRGPPGSTVLIYLDGKVIGRVACDGEGRWSLTPDGTVAPGVYTLRIDQLGVDGRVAQRMEMPFQRAEPTAELAASAGGDRIVVQPGNSLWRIARRIYGEGTRYSIIYQANREMIRDPDLIYPGQVFALPAGQVPAR